MIKIRRKTFETNSSSTHSITMCSKDDFDRWVNGELYWDRYGNGYEKGSFLSYEELDKLYHKDPTYSSKYTLEDFMEGDAIYTYERYMDEIDFETFQETYTTPNGEKVVAFGYYGFDG